MYLGCRTIYQKLLLDKEGKLKIQQEMSVSAIKAESEPVQEQDKEVSYREAKRQRSSQSPSGDSKIDLTFSEERVSD